MSLIDAAGDRLVRHEDGTVTLTLRKPIATKTGEEASLTARRPILDDLLAHEKASGDDLTKTVLVVARLTGVSINDLDGIYADDSMLLADVMSEMLEYGESGSLLDRHQDRLTITDYDASLHLLKPITTLEGEADEIVMRRPTLKEVRSNQGKTLAASVKFLALLTGLGPNVLGKLDALDSMVLTALVADFLGKSRNPTPGGL